MPFCLKLPPPGKYQLPPKQPANICRTTPRCDVTAQDYLERLQHTLPRGIIWQLENSPTGTDQGRTYSRFWHAIAETFAWLNNTICSALDEFFPCRAEDQLQRWAEIYDYPIACIGFPQTAEKLCEWLNIINSPCFGPNLWTLRAITDFAEIDYIDGIEERQALALSAGAPIGIPAGNGQCLTAVPVSNDCVNLGVNCDPYGCKQATALPLPAPAQMPTSGKVCCEPEEPAPDCDGVGIAGCTTSKVPECTLRLCMVVIQLNDNYQPDCISMQAGECCSCLPAPISEARYLLLECLINNFMPITNSVFIATPDGQTIALAGTETNC